MKSTKMIECKNSNNSFINKYLMKTFFHFLNVFFFFNDELKIKDKLVFY